MSRAATTTPRQYVLVERQPVAVDHPVPLDDQLVELAKDALYDAGVLVITSFEGNVDRPGPNGTPLLFETLVVTLVLNDTEEESLEYRDYATWDAAMRGHQELVANWRAQPLHPAPGTAPRPTLATLAEQTAAELGRLRRMLSEASATDQQRRGHLQRVERLVAAMVEASKQVDDDTKEAA